MTQIDTTAIHKHWDLVRERNSRLSEKRDHRAAIDEYRQKHGADPMIAGFFQFGRSRVVARINVGLISAQLDNEIRALELWLRDNAYPRRSI